VQGPPEKSYSLRPESLLDQQVRRRPTWCCDSRDHYTSQPEIFPGISGARRFVPGLILVQDDGRRGSREEKPQGLAQRLLSHPHPEGQTSVELFVGQLPESLAVEIPLSLNSQLLGSALHSRRGQPTLVEALFDAESDPQE